LSESRVYDAAGNVIHSERRDAAGFVTWQRDLAYDVQGHIVSDSNPASPGTAKTNLYDDSGFLSASSDEEGRTTSYLPDGLNRVKKVTRAGFDPTGTAVSLDVAQFSYQSWADSLLQVASGNALATSYAHDDFGRLYQLQSPNRPAQPQPLQFVYDARGNLLSRSESGGPSSVVAAYTYDGLDRLLTVNATNSLDGSSISYSYRYDETPYPGRLTSVVEPERTVRYDYDPLGRITAVTMQENAASAALVTRYSYNGDGVLTGVTYPSGLQVQFAVDQASHEVTQVLNGTSGAIYANQVTHWPEGPLKGLVFGNGGLSLSQSYNLRYEPLSVQSGPVSLAYGPTPSGDIGAVLDQTTDALGCERNTTLAVSYDFLDRLQSWSQSTQAGTGTCAAESLNGLANGTSYVSGTDQIARQYTPNQSSQGTYAYAYDYEGNVSGIGLYDSQGVNIVGVVCLRHDALGRMILAGTKGTGISPGGAACLQDSEVSTVLARFKYDAQNRRVARQQGNQWIYVLPDSNGNPLSEMALVNGAWNKLRDYVWLDGRLLAQIEYSATSTYVYYAHLDHLGTPRVLTNAAGQPVWSTFQLPYGEIWEHSVVDPLSGVTVVTNQRLPGQYDERLLGSLGLQGPYYNWNRWYLPGLGRYLEPDSIALAGVFNWPYGVDWYGYGRNSPLRYADPTGLVPQWLRTLTLLAQSLLHQRSPPIPLQPEPPPPSCPIIGPPPPPTPPPPWLDLPLPIYPWIIILPAAPSCVPGSPSCYPQAT